MGNRPTAVQVDFVGPRLEGFREYHATAGVGRYVYGLPCSTARAIRLDASTGESELIGPKMSSIECYHAAVVVDNCVYGIPFCARRIMRINGDTGDVERMGPKLPGGQKYRCAGVVGRLIYAIPCDAEQVLRIDCSTGVVDFVGPDLGNVAKKYEAAVVVDGCIYAPPCNANRVLRVNGGTGQVELIGPDLGDATFKYLCAAGVGQHVYALPHKSANRVLRITHSTEECGLVGPELRGGYSLASAIAAGGKVFGFPATTEGRILRMEASSGQIDFVGSGTVRGKFWATAVVGRCAYGLPFNSTHLFKVDVDTGDVERVRLSWTGSFFFGAVVLNERIYAFPYKGGRVLRITPSRVQPLINRWGTDITNVLIGTHNFYPNGFLPAHTAAECLDHVFFPGHLEVVRIAREAAAMHPEARRGHIMVIHAYTQDSNLYKQLTASMRQTDDERLPNWMEYIYHLEGALSRQPLFEGTAFRGVDIQVPRSVYQPGTNITWQSFSSATRRAWVLVLQGFVERIDGDRLSGTIFVIRASNARCVRTVSDMPADEEVIFQPNTHFFVRDMVTEEREKRAALPELEAYNLEKLRVFLLEEL